MKIIQSIHGLKVLVCLLAMFSVQSCEQLEWDAGTDEPDDESLVNVTLTVSPYSQTSFGEKVRAAGSIGAVCKRISIVVFQDGEKVKTIHQTSAGDDFGNVSLKLPSGTYELVTIAHNSESTASIATDGRITFASNVVTDSFCDYSSLEVGTESVSLSIEVKRVVAMFRVITTDEMPAAATQLKFYYTGASSTFNPFTGFGCVNSRQTVKMDIREGQDTFEVYTFPHETDDFIDVTVTALNAADQVVGERKFEDVPITVGYITTYNGELFTSSSSDGLIHITANPAWGGNIWYDPDK